MKQYNNKEAKKIITDTDDNLLLKKLEEYLEYYPNDIITTRGVVMNKCIIGILPSYYCENENPYSEYYKYNCIFARKLLEAGGVPVGMMFDGKIEGIDEPSKFFAQNYFYTTECAKITRDFKKVIILPQEVVSIC